MNLPTLAEVIAKIESSNNPFAIRVEGMKFERFSRDGQRFDQIAKINACTLLTAQMIAATSWGRFQIMGFNLYGVDCNLTRPIGEFLATDEFQTIMFERFLAAARVVTDVLELRDNPVARDQFATKYNGPGNVRTYSDLISSTIISLTMRNELIAAKSSKGPDVA